MTSLDSKIPLRKKSSPGIVHRFRNIGKTSDIFYLRLWTHGNFESNKKTSKALKSEQYLTTCCNVTPPPPYNFYDFDILAPDSTSKFELILKESFLIKHENPVLNRTKSFPLDLFNKVLKLDSHLPKKIVPFSFISVCLYFLGYWSVCVLQLFVSQVRPS